MIRKNLANEVSSWRYISRVGLAALLLFSSHAFARPARVSAEDQVDDATVRLEVEEQIIRGDLRSFCRVSLTVTGELRPLTAGDTIELQVKEDDGPTPILDDLIWDLEEVEPAGLQVSPEEEAAQLVERVYDCTSALGEGDQFGGLELFARASIDKDSCRLVALRPCRDDSPTTNTISVEFIEDDDDEEDDEARTATPFVFRSGVADSGARVARDEDWFRLDLEYPSNLELSLGFDHPTGALTMRLQDESGAEIAPPLTASWVSVLNDRSLLVAIFFRSPLARRETLTSTASWERSASLRPTASPARAKSVPAETVAVKNGSAAHRAAGLPGEAVSRQGSVVLVMKSSVAVTEGGASSGSVPQAVSGESTALASNAKRVKQSPAIQGRRGAEGSASAKKDSAAAAEGSGAPVRVTSGPARRSAETASIMTVTAPQIRSIWSASRALVVAARVTPTVHRSNALAPSQMVTVVSSAVSRAVPRALSVVGLGGETGVSRPVEMFLTVAQGTSALRSDEGESSSVFPHVRSTVIVVRGALAGAMGSASKLREPEMAPVAQGMVMGQETGD